LSRAELVPAAQRFNGLTKPASYLVSLAEMAVGLGPIRLEADRLAIGGDRDVEVACLQEGLAKLGVGQG
jgi:hypothetical protein